MKRETGKQLRELICCDSRKVDVGLRRSIEVVREHVQCNVRDDLRNLSIGKACLADACELLIADATAAFDYCSRELECRFLPIRGTPLATRDDLIARQADSATQRGMRRKTVIIYSRCRQPRIHGL